LIDVDVADYLPFVRAIARRLRARLPANIEVDDLVQAGMIGLIDARCRFDPSQGVPFEGFAIKRARGAMLDELRRDDWVPRSVRRGQRANGDAVGEMVSLDDIERAGASADPSSVLAHKQAMQALAAMLERLPAREQQVLMLRCEHDMTLKQIAEVLGVTEPRVCQLQAQAIAQLRRRLRGHSRD
jgi:RNA polymerase sigma factor for flagellar operon FliA